MVELDGHDMLGRPVKIKPGVVKSQQQRMDGEKGPLFSVDRWRRNDTPTFAKVNSDSSRRLYVGGLPKLTDHEALSININNFFKDYEVYVYPLSMSHGRSFEILTLVSLVRMSASCLLLTPPRDSNPVTTTTFLSTSALSKRLRRP